MPFQQMPQQQRPGMPQAGAQRGSPPTPSQGAGMQPPQGAQQGPSQQDMQKLAQTAQQLGIPPEQYAQVVVAVCRILNMSPSQFLQLPIEQQVQLIQQAGQKAGASQGRGQGGQGRGMGPGASQGQPMPLASGLGGA